MAEVSKEERMKLAIKAFNQGRFQSKTSCAQAFDVPSRTLMKRLNGVTSRKESTHSSEITFRLKHYISLTVPL